MLSLVLVSTVLLVPPALRPAGATPRGPEVPPGRSEETGHRTLSRQRDPIVLENEDLSGAFEGERADEVLLYAYTAEQGFAPIPHQFDFIGKDGLVIPDHVNRVREKAVYDFVPNPDLPERLGGRYQLIFMARDMGDRYPEARVPPGFSRALEIRGTDPVTGARGWAYLMMPLEQPAPPGDDYVAYTLLRDGARTTEQIRATDYVTGFPDADKPFAYGSWKIPPDAGGTGVNLLQTFRVRMTLKILMWTLHIDPKNNIVPYVLAYNDGPVRVTRRVYSDVVVGGMKMNRFMGDAKLETESHYYGSYFYFDGEVSLPGFLKKLSKIRAMFTTDFSATATGMAWYNAENPDGDGCMTDGKMSPEEASLDRSPYRWTVLVGRQGGWANILRMYSKSLEPNMKLFYLDDSGYANPEDADVNGTWSSTGYFLDRLDEVEEKVTFRTYILAVPSTFRVPEDTGELVDLVYHPLEVSVSGDLGTSASASR